MAGMGKHSGEPEQQASLPRRRLLILALGVTATVVAWGFLVWEAIDFGTDARGGEAPAWLFLVIATLGATACLLVSLILINKLLATLRGEARQQPTASSGGRRAAR
jgi:hypothetical protein